MGEGNGKVIRGIFWTLILGGFAFTGICFGYTFATDKKIEKIAVKLADEMVCNDRIRQSEDKSIVAGQIIFDGLHFQGYNGTSWKQLDNN